MGRSRSGTSDHARTRNFGNVPTITVGCGDTTTGTYNVELGTGSNGTCDKPGAGQYSFDTWTTGNQTFFKFVPLGQGTGKVLVAEKLVGSYTPNPAHPIPQTTLEYDDDLSNGYQGVEMPYCKFDPRTSDPDKTTITARPVTTRRSKTMRTPFFPRAPRHAFSKQRRR